MSYWKIFVAALLAGIGLNARAVSADTRSPSPLIWEPTNLTYTAKVGEVGAHVVFKVRNPTDHEVTLDDVKTSCGCTVAQFPTKPWRLAPGETNKLDVLVDIRGKWGKVSKDVTLFSTNLPTTLSIELNIPPVSDLSKMLPRDEANRVWGQELAAIDHQAVFKRDCVKCHLEPAFGKYGKDLYNAACTICHEAKHRATMVPDLHALKTPINTNYWHEWITYGKQGTLMPGFAATLGGPLDEGQIQSLVAYMTTNFPRPLLKTAAIKSDKQQN